MTKEPQKKKILITGGAGFIGSNLTEYFLAEGYKVTVLDNFLTGYRENLKPFMDHPCFTLIEGDIRDFDCCRNAVKDAEYVLHEAALGSVPRSMKNPQMSLEINEGGFINMLEAAREQRVRRFIYAASSSVYGDDTHAFKQEDCTGNVLSPYALSKKLNEITAFNYSRIFGIETIGLRYFNVFGRRQDPDGAYAAVIPRFLLSLIHHEAPTIYGDGSSSRDFTYIDNVIQANEKAMLTENPEAVNTVYNIACGAETTLNELFAVLQENLAEKDLTIRSVAVQYGPPRKGDIAHSLADISRAVKLLGYVPEIDVAEGLKRTVDWYWNEYGCAEEIKE